MTTKSAPARRAMAESRPSRSATLGRRPAGSRPAGSRPAGSRPVEPGRGTATRAGAAAELTPGAGVGVDTAPTAPPVAPPGRSTTSRSTARPESSAPAMDSPSSRPAGVTTTSHSGTTPRATASTGSKLRERSSQAAMRPAACASATRRSASVVVPLDASPWSATLAALGSPPGPRMASTATKPVEMTLPRAGSGAGTSRSSTSRSGAVARAPMVRGAAAPQRAWRLARAAVTSLGRALMGLRILERMFELSTGFDSGRPTDRVPRGRHAGPSARLRVEPWPGLRATLCPRSGASRARPSVGM